MNHQINAMNHQINAMDYRSLVNMLLMQITPETRQQILMRLIEMNHKFLDNNRISQETLSQKKNYQKQDSYQGRMNNVDSLYNDDKFEDEIDIDDIIDDIYPKDDLEDKLARIKSLYTKIMVDKNKRQNSRRNNSRYSKKE